MRAAGAGLHPGRVLPAGWGPSCARLPRSQAGYTRLPGSRAAARHVEIWYTKWAGGSGPGRAGGFRQHGRSGARAARTLRDRAARVLRDRAVPGPSGSGTERFRERAAPGVSGTGASGGMGVRVKPASFAYRRAGSVPEAVDLLGEL